MIKGSCKKRKLNILLIILFFSLAFHISAIPKANVDSIEKMQLLDSIVSLYKNQSYLDCIKKIDNHIVSEKDDTVLSALYFLRFSSYEALGQYEKALLDSKYMTEKWPENMHGFYGSGRILAKLNRNTEALRYYSVAIEKEPTLEKVFFYRALTKISLNDISGALEDLTSALEQDNYDYMSAYTVALIIFTFTADSKESLSWLELSIKISPDFVDAYSLRSICNLLSGNIDESIKDSTTYINLINNGSYSSMAGKNSLGKRKNEFLANGYYARATAYRVKEDATLSLKDINDAIKLNPEYGGYYRFRANLYLKLGQTDLYKKDVEKLKQISGGAKIPDDVSEIIEDAINQILLETSLDKFQKNQVMVR